MPSNVKRLTIVEEPKPQSRVRARSFEKAVGKDYALSRDKDQQRSPPSVTIPVMRSRDRRRAHKPLCVSWPTERNARARYFDKAAFLLRRRRGRRTQEWQTRRPTWIS